MKTGSVASTDTSGMKKKSKFESIKNWNPFKGGKNTTQQYTILTEQDIAKQDVCHPDKVAEVIHMRYHASDSYFNPHPLSHETVNILPSPQHSPRKATVNPSIERLPAANQCPLSDPVNEEPDQLSRTNLRDPEPSAFPEPSHLPTTGRSEEIEADRTTKSEEVADEGPQDKKVGAWLDLFSNLLT